MILLAAEAPSLGLVVGLGIGMVFVGLICLIAICYLLGAVIKLFENRKPVTESAPAPAPAAAPAVIENRQEFIAAVSAAIAEELGKDVSAIRIKSIKKL